MIIDCKKIAVSEKESLKKKFSNIKNVVLAIIMVSPKEETRRFVANKTKLLDELGIMHKDYFFDGITQSELNNLLDNLSQDKNITAIMPELPMPENINMNEMLTHINPAKDVDGLTNENLGNLLKNVPAILPCTVRAVDLIFKSENINLKGKRVAVVGRGVLVGKPMQMFLTNCDATVTLCHSKTENLKEITENSDIVITAIGKKEFFTADYFAPDAVIIDVSTNYFNGKVYGDVCFNEVNGKRNLITPVPGGVGLLTKYMLCENLFDIKKI